MSEYIVKLSDAIDMPDMVGGERITRCRDCKHFIPEGTHNFENGKTNTDCCKYIRGFLLQITPDGYCAWGEPREES